MEKAEGTGKSKGGFFLQVPVLHAAQMAHTPTHLVKLETPGKKGTWQRPKLTSFTETNARFGLRRSPPDEAPTGPKPTDEPRRSEVSNHRLCDERGAVSTTKRRRVRHVRVRRERDGETSSWVPKGLARAILGAVMPRTWWARRSQT